MTPDPIPAVPDQLAATVQDLEGTLAMLIYYPPADRAADDDLANPVPKWWKLPAGQRREPLSRQRGGTYRTIAAAPTTVRDLAIGRRDGTSSIATALPAVTSDTLPQGRLDARGTRLRLRALHVMGHSSTRIARAVGASDKTIRKLVRGDAKTISPALHDAIADVYDAWWDKRAPRRTRAERTTATVARRRAIVGNWCAGAAPDIHPPRHPRRDKRV